MPPVTAGTLGTTECVRILRSALYPLNEPGKTTSTLREQDVGNLLRAIGRKPKLRWEVQPERLLNALTARIEVEPTPAATLIRVVMKDSPPLLEITTTKDAGIVQALFVDGLQWQLLRDHAAKRRLDAFAREREKIAQLEADQHRAIALDRINRDVDDLRKAIVKALPLFDAGLGTLRHMRRIAPHADKLTEVQNALTRREERGGRIDRLLNIIVEEYDLYRAKQVPRLLSNIGMLIDANFCLRFLKAQEACQRHFGIADPKALGYDYLAEGWYRPHTELLKDMPRYFYDGPGYLAPVEDLLDWTAIEFYAAGKQTVADDATVGWLLEAIAKEVDQELGLLNSLVKGSQYWTEERLTACVSAWREARKNGLTLPRHW